jgi:16S rRNA G527 N7-methylase RsmG
LPLAGWRPALQVTLLEAAQRKAVFLREVSRQWGNVEVRNDRLEGLSGAWDVAAMRAVALGAALPHLARVCRRVAVLTSAEGVEQAHESALFAWGTPVALPWGDRRVLLVGRLAPAA